MSFETLGLRPELLRAVSEEGYTVATPVQERAIPPILQGRDIIAGAQTGTGKTAAFTLPILQLLAKRDEEARAANPNARNRKRIRVLVVTPTRELAMQVEESVRTYGKYLSLNSTTVFGGVGMGNQVKALKAGVDILVATPGRLLDHQGQGTIDLGGVEILVLDEADRMLDMGFIHDIKRVLAVLPKQRQNLLFSATYSDDIHGLATGLLRDPVMVEVARRNADSELVEHLIHHVNKEDKKEALVKVLEDRNMQQVLIFSRTKHGANQLAQWLHRQGIPSAPIHGDRSQNQRIKALTDFKSFKIRVLVATDIAARGLDIEQLPHVVNYDLPQVPEDYVHRAGRTGRAGSPGMAISLVAADDRPMLRDIEKLIKKSLPTAELEGFSADMSRIPQPRVQGRQGNPNRPSPARPRTGNPARDKQAPIPGGSMAHSPASHHAPAGQRDRDHQVRGPREGRRPEGRNGEGRPDRRPDARHGERGGAPKSAAPRMPARESSRDPVPLRPGPAATSERAKAIRSAVNDLVRSGL